MLGTENYNLSCLPFPFLLLVVEPFASRGNVYLVVLTDEIIVFTSPKKNLKISNFPELLRFFSSTLNLFSTCKAPFQCFFSIPYLQDCYTFGFIFIDFKSWFEDKSQEFIRYKGTQPSFTIFDNQCEVLGVNFRGC